MLDLQLLYQAQFNSICDITGLPFKPKGSRMVAACYIDGTPHEKFDKTYAVLKPNGVYIKENGGEDLSLPEWLNAYGEISKLNVEPCGEMKVKNTPERHYVDRELFYNPIMPMQYQNNLFKFLASKFGQEATKSVFIRYGVGELDKDRVVFWYQNELSDICHDVIIHYGTDGKREKGRGASRKHLIDDGYSATCLFGQHLLTGHIGDVCVVESEKTALVMSLAEYGKDMGRIWLATGGSKKMSGIREGWKLYPDFDDEGMKWGGIEWWHGLEVKEGWDVADWVLNNLKIKKE